jgi:cytochrome c553
MARWEISKKGSVMRPAARGWWSVAYALSLLVASPVFSAPAELPLWAYPTRPADFKPAPDDGTIRRVPGSTAGYTLSQTRDLFAAPDWHPDDHPKMPDIVANGRKPVVYACGFCHRAEGTGGPENASLAGLPVAYIVQQMADYKSGARGTALPERLPQKFMIALAKAATIDEVKAAAAYFSALKPKTNIRVVEAESVPQSVIGNWIFEDRKNGMTEPLGRRILEMPEELERFELRDTGATFVAYVPMGSIQRGKDLVEGKNDKVPECAGCHNRDMKGDNIFPPIAGRSPSYVVRQLYEMQNGIRAGKGATKMRATVANLDMDDMIAIAAYLATLPH